MPCSAACFPIAAFSLAENFSYAPLVNLLLSFATLLHSSLAFSTSGFTKLFTTSIQEDGIVFDNDPVGSRRSNSGVISFCLEKSRHYTLHTRNSAQINYVETFRGENFHKFYSICENCEKFSPSKIQYPIT